jgi:hypothetical protein
MALWNNMHQSFRALDEFDVYMDSANRKIATKLIIDNSRLQNSNSQYLLITPQSMSNVGFGGSDVRVVKLNDPERNQTTLSFSSSRK